MNISHSSESNASNNSPVDVLPSWIPSAAPGLPEPVIEYHDDGITVSSLKYYNHDDKLHCENGPAIRSWHKNGTKRAEDWYVNGNRHREDGPATQTWYENGAKKWEYWHVDDKLHRVDGPAKLGWYENGVKYEEQFVLNDKLHREDGQGPAIQYWKRNGDRLV